MLFFLFAACCSGRAVSPDRQLRLYIFADDPQRLGVDYRSGHTPAHLDRRRVLPILPQQLCRPAQNGENISVSPPAPSSGVPAQSVPHCLPQWESFQIRPAARNGRSECLHPLQYPSAQILRPNHPNAGPRCPGQCVPLMLQTGPAGT